MGFGTSKEKKTQLFFRDDNKFQFIKRPLEYSCLVEKKGDIFIKGWKHFFGNQLFFAGYKKISADAVTLGFSRDIILDPFDRIPKGDSVSEKPKAKDEWSIKRWIAKIATNQRHIYQTKRKSTMKDDIINVALVAVLGSMTVAWLITFLVEML